MDVKSLFDSVDRWAAVRTAARWEKAVAEQLNQAGVASYLPLMKRVSRSKSKCQSAMVPIFPGYVFCSETDYRDNPRIPWGCRQKIAQLLRTPDPARLKLELSAVAGLLADRQLIQERFYGAIGDTVRIIGGPLVGSIGEIIRLKPGTSRIVLEVSFLGACVEATLEEKYLEKVRPLKRDNASNGKHSQAIAGRKS